MSGEIENAARSMMSSPQGLKIIKGLDKYNTAMNTESGRQLIQMIAGSGTDALKQAAQTALSSGKEPGRPAAIAPWRFRRQQAERRSPAQLPGRGGAGGKGHRGHGSVTRYG